jgi:CheY-like chemotaxis protein
VRRLTTAVLVRSGYRVLEAADALRALEQWRFEHGEIDLLLSDIVLPGELNGTELATRLRAEKPSLKVLLTTGYLVDEQRHAALKDAGWTLLQKPYELRLLAEAVRQRLDESW